MARAAWLKHVWERRWTLRLRQEALVNWSGGGFRQANVRFNLPIETSHHRRTNLLAGNAERKASVLRGKQLWLRAVARAEK